MTIQKGDRYTLQDVIVEFDKNWQDAERLNFLVRDSKLQEEQRKKIIDFKSFIRGFKYQAISAGNELHANLFFQMQCALNSIASMLRMWTLLKENEPAHAWNYLVDAQEYIDIALRVPVNAGSVGFDDLRSKCASVEGLIFPNWTGFLSPSITVTVGDCSICGKNFAVCTEHLEGLIYSGTLCRQINGEIINGDHLALVKEPKDRRCIIRKVEAENGYMRDNITWAITEEIASNKDAILEKGLMISGIFLSTSKLELD